MTTLQGYGLTETWFVRRSLFLRPFKTRRLLYLSSQWNGRHPCSRFLAVRKCWRSRSFGRDQASRSVASFSLSLSIRFADSSLVFLFSDHPEAGYLTSNNPPQGEVLLGGGSVFKGYFKRPDLDAEVSLRREPLPLSFSSSSLKLILLLSPLFSPSLPTATSRLEILDSSTPT